MAWSSYQPLEIVHRRAGGRRKYNAERRRRAEARREQIRDLLGGGNEWLLIGKASGRGLVTRHAEHFGVNKSTISRDRVAMLREWHSVVFSEFPSLEPEGE